MSPKTDNQNQSEAPETEVRIPHDKDQKPPAAAPPLVPTEPPEPPSPRPPLPTPSPPEQPEQVKIQPQQVTVVPEFHEDVQELQGRRWPVLIMYFGLALAVAVLVVFGGRWVYKQITGNESKPTPPSPTGQGAPPTPAPTPAPAAPTPSVSQNQTAQPTPSGQLPNNGPGEVAAIFVGTAIIVGGLHYLIGLRRAR